MLLNKNERKLIGMAFRPVGAAAHPLLEVCDQVFKTRAAMLHNLKAQPEDLFRAVAQMHDRLFDKKEKPRISQQYIDDWWNDMAVQLRDDTEAPVADRQLFADTVFRLVRRLCCYHWDVFYTHTIYDWLSDTLKRKSNDIGKDEQEAFERRLLEFSQPLDDWVNQTYHAPLAPEIESAIKGNLAAHGLPQKRSGRKPVGKDNITASFNYLPNIENRAVRLQAFFECLKGSYIDGKTDMQIFIDMFSNKSTKDKLIWVSTVRELKYLLKSLKDKKFVTVQQGYTIWQVASARFQVRVKVNTLTDDGRENYSYDIKKLEPRDFTKDSNKNIYPKLDSIIKLLAPKTDLKNAIQDILDNTNEANDSKRDYIFAWANQLKLT